MNLAGCAVPWPAAPPLLVHVHCVVQKNGWIRTNMYACDKVKRNVFLSTVISARVRSSQQSQCVCSCIEALSGRDVSRRATLQAEKLLRIGRDLNAARFGWALLLHFRHLLLVLLLLPPPPLGRRSGTGARAAPAAVAPAAVAPPLAAIAASAGAVARARGLG